MTDPILLSNFTKGLEFLQEFDDRSITDAKLINTKQLLNSGRIEVKVEGDAIIGIMYREAHGIYQNFGVKRANFNIGIKRWLQVTKTWAKIVKPGLTDKEITKFQSAVYFKKKGLPASAFALKPRPWIKKGNELIERNFAEITGIDEYLNVLLNASLEMLAA